MQICDCSDGIKYLSLSPKQSKELKKTISELYEGADSHVFLSCAHCFWSFLFIDDEEILLASLKGLASVTIPSWDSAKMNVLQIALVRLKLSFVSLKCCV